jgi:transcriptional regulator with XRE-family HTH domain
MRAISSKKKAEALALKRTGMSYADVAKRVGCSRSAVQTWERRERMALETPAVAAPVVPPSGGPPDEPPEPPRDVLPADADALTRAKHLQAKLFAQAEAAERDGNHTASTRALTQAGSQALLIARLEKGLRQDGDVVTLQRSEVAAAQQSLTDRLAVLATVRLTCPDCGRDLRVRTAKGE